MKLWTLIMTLFIGFGILPFSATSFAQSKKTQMSCRAKAQESVKEAVKVAYDQCMSVAKEDEAEKIRKEYKAKIAKLREYYEKKLKKLNLKPKSTAKAAAAASSGAEAASALPQKITTNPDLGAETTASTYSVPTPINTQEIVTEPPTSLDTTGETLPPETANEPLIRLKPATQDDNPPLETAPELTI